MYKSRLMFDLFRTYYPVLLARTSLFFSAGFQNMDWGTKLTVKNATDAKTMANSTSWRSESNGQRPGPGFGQNPGRKRLNFILPTRAIRGYNMGPQQKIQADANAENTSGPHDVRRPSAAPHLMVAAPPAVAATMW